MSAGEDVVCSKADGPKRGRPRKQLDTAATSKWIGGINHMLLSSKAAYSSDKGVVECTCGNSKHCRFMAVQQIARRDDAFSCRVCQDKGSNHEKLLYKSMDQEPLINLYAVETYSLSEKQQLRLHNGDVVQVNRHAWDAMTIDPPNLLIEVQGEGHTSKMVTKANNSDDTLSIRAQRDQLLATAAHGAGFSVLWLCMSECGSETSRERDWAAKLKEAVAHVAAGKPPQLFIA